MLQRARVRRTRWTTFMVVLCSLLLQGAAPLLAYGAAQAQGKTLFEVCSVYGVQFLPADSSESEPQDDRAAHQGACALNALSCVSIPPAAGTGAPGADIARIAFVLSPAGVQGGPDPHARWQARRKQGPPPAA